MSFSDYNNSDAEAAHLCRMLSGLCSRITETRLVGVIQADPELVEWWAERQKIDARDRAYELRVKHDAEIVKQALSKLTPEEIEKLKAAGARID